VWDAVRAFSHDAPEGLDAATGEKRSEVTRILEVDNLRHLFASFQTF